MNNANITNRFGFDSEIRSAMDQCFFDPDQSCFWDTQATTGATVQSSSTRKDDPKAVASKFFEQSDAHRVNTNAYMYREIKAQHPDVNVTVVPRVVLNLQAYAGHGQATMQRLDQADNLLPNGLKWTYYRPPPRRTGHGVGSIVEQDVFQVYLYKWEKFEFLVYFADGGGLYNTFYYIVGEEAAIDMLLMEAGLFLSSLHRQIWVYQGYYWSKDAELYQAIMKASWDDIILPEKLKEDLAQTVKRFFNSKDEYRRLRVPWKRGLIFHGPPGNGKTITIKATMHTLYERDPPIPTLYVKSLKGGEPAVDSIFSLARQQAPCYLVFEDLDTLINDSNRSFFFNAVDGIAENDGILMIGSTNHLDKLDPGLAKRPSRFDRKFSFPLPDLELRIHYCQYWQKKLASIGSDLDFPDKMCQAIAQITDEFSFAYLQEAFISTLVKIARDRSDEGESAGQPDTTSENSGVWQFVGLNETLHDMGANKTERNASSTVDEGSGNIDMYHDSDNEGLEKYLLWREIKVQIEILREGLSEQ